tara:strand:+ start:685 stop:882 length:198 start_codon:yes stop_codon:yes gene_type:complete
VKKPKRFRAKNYSCRGQKCANQPQLSIAASEELKDDVLKYTQAKGISVSNWVRSLMEKELTRKAG